MRFLFLLFILLLPAPAHAAAVTMVLDAPQREDLGTADVLKEFICPKDTRWARVRFETNDGKVQYSGTDGGAVDATDYELYAGDITLDLRLPGTGFGRDKAKKPISIFLASATANTFVGVNCVESGS